MSWSVPRAKSHCSHLHSTFHRFTPSSSPRSPLATSIGSDHTQLCLGTPSPLVHRQRPEHSSECTPLALGMQIPSEITWTSHDNHATTCHPGHLVGRPPSQWMWDLRVPTLFLSNLSYCMLILHWLLYSGYTCTCSHSPLTGQLYAPCALFASLSPSPPMWTATIVTDTLWPLSWFQFDSNSIPNMSPVLWVLFLIVLVMKLLETMISSPQMQITKQY